jgi:hypothetical protein
MTQGAWPRLAVIPVAVSAAFMGSVSIPAQPASAAPMTLGAPFLILDQRAANDVGMATGARISFGDNTVIPNGSLGTTATATTIPILGGSPQTFTVPFVGSPAIPNQFFRSIPFDSNLTGPYTLNFVNGPDTASVTTPSLLGVTAPPYATSVTFSGSSATPTFTWSYPAGSVNGTFFDIFDKSLPNAAGGASLVYTHTLPGTANSWTVPTTLARGLTLQLNHQYTLDLYGVASRNTALPLSNPNSAAWSEAFFDFTPTPAGSPVVNLPTIVTGGAYQYSMSVVAGQTYFVDPAVTTGYRFAIGAGDPNFVSVLLPAIQNNPYDLSFLDNGTMVTDLVDPNIVFDFPTGGVGAFTVTGIDPSLGLDSTDTTAFITGLTFESDGTFTGTQTPIVSEVAAPEPASSLVILAGLLGLGLVRRGRTSPT